jgi:hypothetical protein
VLTEIPQILGKHLEVGPSGRKVCLLSLPLFVTGAYQNVLIAAGKVQYGGSFYGYFFKYKNMLTSYLAIECAAHEDTCGPRRTTSEEAVGWLLQRLIAS